MKIETVIEIHQRNKFSPKYEITVSKEPYKEFKIGDRYYHSNMENCCVLINDQDTCDRINRDKRPNIYIGIK